MKTLTVEQLMIPIAEYATVSEEATLFEAIMALEEAQRGTGLEREKPRAVLVLDRNKRCVGKLSQWDVIAGIEPRYKGIEELKETSRFGFSPEFLRSMLKNYGLWRKPLDDLCKKAAETSVKDIMSSPVKGECVDESASLDEAIHLLVMGRHESLLVMRGDAITGILRRVDVFRYISERIKACKL